MANSTVRLQTVTTYAKTFSELASVVQRDVAGSSLEPALTVANDTMIAMVAEPFNFKWNRFRLPLFYTNGWQQDYALNVVNLGWLEHGYLVDINNTSQPKPIWPLEIVKDLEATSGQYGQPGQVCWLPNDQLLYGTWGAPNIGTASPAPSNPQPSQTIQTPLGVLTAPNNPWLQVADAFGNFWVVTTFGTTGSSNPFSSNLQPVYPTPQNPTQTATTVTDGTVVWTAVNPKAAGIRCTPLPPQLGVVYQFNCIGQWKAFAFTNGPFTAFNQYIEPIPDDFAKYFRDGFVALMYQHAEDPKTLAKADRMYARWMQSLMDAKKQGDRERDNAGFYPATTLMQGPLQIQVPNAAYPFAIT